MDKFLLFLCMQFSFVGIIWGYGTMVPITQDSRLCTDMKPDHSEVYDRTDPNSNIAPYLSAQSGAPLYEIAVNNTCFKAGDVLKVTLRGKVIRTTYTAFLGVFLMARKSSSPTAGENYGTFTTPTGESNLATYNCFSKARSAVGHNNRNTKRNNYVLWTAPSDFTDDMVFVATFVEERTVFWTNVQSNEIEYDDDCGSANAIKASFISLVLMALSHMSVKYL